MTVGEVLGCLHEQHRLSIRFDAPTLASMLGSSSIASQLYSDPGEGRFRRGLP